MGLQEDIHATRAWAKQKAEDKGKEQKTANNVMAKILGIAVRERLQNR